MLGGSEDAGAFRKIGAYYIYFLAILAAADVLQIPLLSQFINDAAAYLPASIAGLLIVVVVFIVADFVSDMIVRSASTTGSDAGSMLARGVQVFLYFIVIVVRLDTMQVSVSKDHCEQRYHTADAKVFRIRGLLCPATVVCL